MKISLPQFNLLRKLSPSFSQSCGELKGGAYKHPIAVDNALRPLAKAGLVETGYYGTRKGRTTGQMQRRHTLTPAGESAIQDYRAEHGSML